MNPPDLLRAARSADTPPAPASPAHPQSAIRNPQSAIRNPKFAICVLALLLLAAISAPTAPVQANAPSPAALQVALPAGAEYHVSPDGSPDGDGSEENPWDLATALKQVRTIGPGSTVWVHGGTYRGSFTSRLAGTEQQPIIVRAYPGERATLDGAGSKAVVLTVQGPWAWYWGLEIMNSDPKRVTELAGSHPSDMPRGDGLSVLAPHTKLINLIVHDNASGIGSWGPAEGAEIYGVVVFNNGWKGPDRGHGHGLYIQNERGTKRIEDVLLFNNFGWGTHAYAESGRANGLHFEGIASFNSGAATALISGARNRYPNFLIGTRKYPVDHVELSNSYFFHPAESSGNNVEIGYTAKNNGRATLSNNFIVGGPAPLIVKEWGAAAVTGNVVAARPATTSGESFLATLRLAEQAEPSASTWDDNTYYEETSVRAEAVRRPFRFASGASPSAFGSLSFEAWQRSTGFDRQTTYAPGRLAGVRVFVRPNRYEPGRAHIIIYNGDEQGALDVDVSNTGLAIGAAYEVRDAQDYFGEPVLSGEYDGSPLHLPLVARPVAAPVGLDSGPEHTCPEFCVFVLVPK